MSNTEAKYEALQRLLVATGTRGEVDLNDVLAVVCRAVGLAACALALDPYDGQMTSSAGDDWAREALQRYADDLWGQLLRDHQVESAFLQLAPEGEPLSLFAYPLRRDGQTAGVVLGLVRGRRQLAREEDFLLALATALQGARAVRAAAASASPASLAEAVEKARQAAILETAIAVNHEVNNPLTAVLGNTQLLLLHTEGLDPQTRKRLQDIEKSALRIKDVTQRLLKKGPHRTTDYAGGLRMLDLSEPDPGEDAAHDSPPDSAHDD